MNVSSDAFLMFSQQTCNRSKHRLIQRHHSVPIQKQPLHFRFEQQRFHADFLITLTTQTLGLALAHR
ncbi:MAG TPA: hypothetical protein V6C65_30025, partial [Allocoleopsis sp.]